MKRVLISATYMALAAFVVAMLSGCVGIAIQGADKVTDRFHYNKHIEAATAGDPEAQYAVGVARCCDEEAIEWFCRAAHQGESVAMLRLGQIYLGDTANGFGVVARIVSLGDSDLLDRPQAYYWFQKAAEFGQPDGVNAANELALNAAEAAEAEAYLTGRAAPDCDTVSGPAG